MSEVRDRYTVELAEHYLTIRNPHKALEILSGAESDSIDDYYFWYLLGFSYYSLERYPDADRAAKKGLSIHAESIDLLLLLCNIQTKLNNLAAAERAILSALRQLPDHPVLLCRYASLVASDRQLDKAEKLVEEAARSDPDSPVVTRTRAWIAYLRGNDKDAAQGFQEALAAEPEDDSSLFLLGLSLSSQGKASQADGYFKRAVRSDPADDVLRQIARASSYDSHWLLIPLRPLQRYGRVPVWIAGVGTVFVLNIIGLSEIALIAAVIYLIFVIYSWIAPAFLMWWMERNDRGFRNSNARKKHR
jgi:tetratricopeptide (TPR) repeat protein